MNYNYRYRSSSFSDRGYNIRRIPTRYVLRQKEYGSIMDSIGSALNNVKSWGKSAGSSMSNFASSAGSVLSKAASSAGNAAKSAGSAISGASSSLMSGVKNGLNKTATTQQTGSTTQANTTTTQPAQEPKPAETTQPATTQTQSTGGSLFAKGGEALKPVLDQNFFDEKIGSTPQTTTTTQQPATTTQSQPATTTQTQTEQQGQGGGFWNKVGNFAGSVMNKTGTGAKKTGSFMKKAAPWIAGLTAAGALAAGIGAGRFIFKDHPRRY